MLRKLRSWAAGFGAWSQRLGARIWQRVPDELRDNLTFWRHSIARTRSQASFVERALAYIGVAVAVMATGALGIAMSALSQGYAAAQGPFAILAALLAVLGLIASAVTAAANFRRQRREATLTAYNKWSDDTLNTRIELRKCLGGAVLSDDLGAELAGDPTLETRRFDDSAIERITKDIVVVLNGLERLAVGVNLGVFDLLVIRQIAGTIVIRYWNWFQPYVLAKRRLSNPQRRQQAVYLELESLAGQLAALHDPEDEHPIDQSRLHALDSGAPGPELVESLQEKESESTPAET